MPAAEGSSSHGTGADPPADRISQYVALTATTGAQNGDTLTPTAEVTLTAELPAIPRDIAIGRRQSQLSGHDGFRGRQRQLRRA